MKLEDDDVATLQQELGWLRKNEGFVQRRLVRAPIVDEMLRGSRDDSFERLKSRFVSAIHTLAEDQQALLLDAYALTPETMALPRLRERRILHGAKIGRGVDTVAAREEAALKFLHSRLVSGRYAQAPLVLDVPEMHGGIIYEETSTLIVVENRRWKATYERYRFANMIEGLQYVTVTRSYPGFVNPAAGGDFKVNTREVPGAGWNDHFWHINQARTATEPMIMSRRYDLMFSVQPCQYAPETDALLLGGRAFHERSLLAIIQIRFIGEAPRQIWAYERVSPFARPSTPAGTLPIPDARGVLSLRLRDLHGGLFSGFSWEW
ncbi:hypothetical protein [Pseudoclavibacter helvolus]|uniref:hypothetical protein n=1 Tax=Pseudoclavibacter helvolus TaxID=255205 RepID=UPI0024AE49FF|nr:hypothetical protein [Pseudoclavibacter helvolus]